MANREHAHCMGHAMGAKGADACAATTSLEGEHQSGAGQSIQAVSGAGALSDQGVRPVPARRMFGRPLAGGQPTRPSHSNLACLAHIARQGFPWKHGQA